MATLLEAEGHDGNDGDGNDGGPEEFYFDEEESSRALTHTKVTDQLVTASPCAPPSSVTMHSKRPSRAFWTSEIAISKSLASSLLVKPPMSRISPLIYYN